jgi:hypothetical protein
VVLVEEPGTRWCTHAGNVKHGLGYVVRPGDHFYEHYYSERWYNIFEVRSAEGVLKGWYCNITRPARFEAKLVTSEDLELDLFVAPDRQQLRGSTWMSSPPLS